MHSLRRLLRAGLNILSQVRSISHRCRSRYRRSCSVPNGIRVMSVAGRATKFIANHLCMRWSVYFSSLLQLMPFICSISNLLVHKMTFCTIDLQTRKCDISEPKVGIKFNFPLQDYHNFLRYSQGIEFKLPHLTGLTSFDGDFQSAKY